MTDPDVANIPLSIGDYWTIFWRRKARFATWFGASLAIGIAVAMLLPPVYRSEATVMIERQTLPANLVETTVTGYVQERIAQARERILSYKARLELATQYDLYPGTRDDDPAVAASLIGQDVEVEMLDVEASDPDQQGQRVATVAFTVAFNAASAESAQSVTRDLTQRFLADHKAAREARTAEVSRFLEAEAEVIEAEIVTLEESLAAFKQEELRSLPELMDVNLRLMERAEAEIEDSKESIRGLQERIDSVQAELSLTQPYKAVQTEDGAFLLSASERLSSLTAQYMRASARYSSEHPDVIRLQREISTLAHEAGSGARADELMSELVALQEDLRQAKQAYSTEHPEVQRLERSVGGLQRGFATAVVAEVDVSEQLTLPPDNPRYVTLRTQLDAARENLVAERQNLGNQQTKLREYEERIFNTPTVERDFKSLSRDYDNSIAKYEELREKQMQARLAQSLEAGANAERWVLVSAAYLPALPDSPNRIGIVLLSVLISFAMGMGAIAVAEYADKTVRGSRMVMRMLGVPPLAVIPEIGAG